jgi:acetyl-CoA carboxylase biotin carboxylase subunit
MGVTSFKKVLVANRGEIALRVIRTLKALGIASVAVYSDADADALHVNSADEALRIGPPLSRKSYLNADNILEAAKQCGADAVHPGYGFLSENSEFALKCLEAGLTFIGPSPEVIALAGDKASARKALSKAGIPIIPGSPGELADEDVAVACADEVGYPVILKASGGGGGRGMRIAHNGDEVRDAFKVASGEAAAAFGNGALYLEKYILNPHHIEIQLLADAFGNVVQLGERECSIQKRHQKLIEEAPSPFVDDGLRTLLGNTAIKAARAIGYENAGTIEFLVDSARNFYFMEINSRIQVEHTITEETTGFDIVEQQLRIAAGEALGFTQADVAITGWAIECRINAADPECDFMPSPGDIKKLILPQGPGVRVDTLLYEGMCVVPFYDSLIAKIITWGENRETAIERMRRALSQTVITGIATTTSFNLKVIESDEFLSGAYDTHFIE